jgi:hypothetical protein
MLNPPVSCRELDLLAYQVLRVHTAHADATADSLRNKLGARLDELEAQFERTLTEEVPDETMRHAWREHLHAHGPAPNVPLPLPIVVFRGRSEVGSEILVRETPDAELRIEVDDTLLTRRIDHARALDIRLEGGQWLLRIEGLGDFRETFAASPDTVDALRSWTDEPRGDPPWSAVRELAADGLIDRTFALMPRGRRALGRLT